MQLIYPCTGKSTAVESSLGGGQRSGNGPVPTVSTLCVYDGFPPVGPVVGGVKRSRMQFKASPGTEFKLLPEDR